MCVCVYPIWQQNQTNEHAHTHTYAHTRTQQASAYKFCNPLTMAAISGFPSRSHNSTGGCEKGARRCLPGAVIVLCACASSSHN